MSPSTRDEQGYQLEGIDVVPIRPKVKKPNKMAELINLWQEVNRCEEKERENADYWRQAYLRLNQDYIALKFEDLCSECKRVKACTDPGETYTHCETCHRGGETVRSLTRKLEEKQKEKNYWQDSCETALRQLSTDFPDGSFGHDQRSDDDPHVSTERLQDFYKGQITQSALLNKAGRLAAKKTLDFEESQDSRCHGR